MEATELQDIVSAIIANRRHNSLRPHELVDAIHRRRFPGNYFPILAPLLEIKNGVTYKYAIDIVGKLKNPPAAASDAIESAWESSWEHDVPQACSEAFRALIRIGGNDVRLLRMINKSMTVDNYDIHKECALALMKIEQGREILENWSDTTAGRCNCHLHKKLAKKICDHLKTDNQS